MLTSITIVWIVKLTTAVSTLKMQVNLFVDLKRHSRLMSCTKGEMSGCSENVTSEETNAVRVLVVIWQTPSSICHLYIQGRGGGVIKKSTFIGMLQ